ncbi:MAG: hypothetical protein BZ136_09030 [Methanosphaera sp. rholeuAM74]|nr:MAG: hypothetical protein BZ136_09030 [Methanosphaera sp. rholeuAM74]
MKIIKKIQKNLSFILPKELTDRVEKNNLDTIEWIIDYNRDIVKIKLVKKIRKTPYDKHANDVTTFGRNIYTQYMVNIPNQVCEFLECGKLDDILIIIEEDDVTVEPFKKAGLDALSALISDEGGEKS